MRIYAISDLHLQAGCSKPMDIFGSTWKGHYDSIREFWQTNVKSEDYVLHCGDFCWAMKFEDAIGELTEFAALPGHKVLIKGNHDLWWASLSKMRAVFNEDIIFIQNSSIVINDDDTETSVILCGTRGWAVPGSADYDSHDEKIYKREQERLKLSLESARKQEALCRYDKKELIVMLHYPPIPMYGQAFENDTDINAVLREYGVNKAVFGHIHKPQQVKSLRFDRDGIEYYLTSCDMLDNRPVIVY